MDKKYCKSIIIDNFLRGSRGDYINIKYVKHLYIRKDGDINNDGNDFIVKADICHNEESYEVILADNLSYEKAQKFLDDLMTKAAAELA